MNTTDWIVLLGGAAAIAWVNWYFFLAERSAPRNARHQRDGRDDA